MIDYIKILKIIRNKAYISTDRFKYEETQYINENYPKRFASDREKIAKKVYIAIFLVLISAGLLIAWLHTLVNSDLDNDFIKVFIYFAPVTIIFIILKIEEIGADSYNKTELLKKELGQEFKKANRNRTEYNKKLNIRRYN